MRNTILFIMSIDDRSQLPAVSQSFEREHIHAPIETGTRTCRVPAITGGFLDVAVSKARIHYMAFCASRPLALPIQPQDSSGVSLGYGCQRACPEKNQFPPRTSRLVGCSRGDG